jgi:hypothetical protein
MGGRWKEVVRLAFKGERFRDHALDLSALTELSRFQKMVAETAKTLWRAAHPDRERLPKHFEDRTRLCLRTIEEGSAVAPLEVFLAQPEEPELWEPEPTELNEAIALAHKVVRSVERDEPLPENFPKSLLPEYSRWGQELADDEEIEVIPTGKEPARLTPRTRSRLVAFSEAPREAQIDVIGEVLEADVRQRRFQLWLDEKTSLTVSFSPEQEDEVTTALKEHRTRRLRVGGRGDMSSQGKPLRITEVTEWRFEPVGEPSYDPTARPIEEVLADLAREVPEDDWKRLPPDLTDNLDHYLYGTPKR